MDIFTVAYLIKAINNKNHPRFKNGLSDLNAD